MSADVVPQKEGPKDFASVLRSQLQQQEEEELKAIYVASQWKLMWWKFKKHKLAIIAGPILIFLYLCAIFADFLSPVLPTTRFAQYKGAPPQPIRFYDPEIGFSKPFIYEIESQADPKTFRRYYVVNKSVRYPVRFFVRGEPYKLLGLIPTDIHLVGSKGPLFLLGSDVLGRDVFTRILYGSRISLSVGLVGIALTFTLGMLLGGLSGYLGGVVDTIIQRVIELLV